jgi:hypothetical protein
LEPVLEPGLMHDQGAGWGILTGRYPIRAVTRHPRAVYAEEFLFMRDALDGPCPDLLPEVTAGRLGNLGDHCR